MRVALLSDVYFPRINGVSTSIETFRRELPAFGVTSLLVAPRYDGETPTQDVIRLPARPVPRDPEDRLMSYRAALALEGPLQEAGVDLIHIQTPFVAQYAGVALARRLGVPVLATYHTLFEEYLHHYLPVLPAGLLRSLARRISRSQCNALDRVVVPSPAMAQRLEAYGVTTPVDVLPTGIPFNQFARGDRTRFRQAFDIPADRPVALYVGRVAFEKNIGFLIEAVRRARTQVPDLLFLIAGEGPARASLEADVAGQGLGDAVRFLDYLDRETQLPDCYAGADLFVFASRTETQGLVLLEALAAGTPALALAEMGTTDILAPGEGTVTSPDDPAAFAALMAELLNDPARRQTLADAAPLHAQRWSDQAQAGRLAHLYQEMLQTHAPETDHTRESPFKGKTGLIRIWNALGYSLAGLSAAYRHEDAFRQEVWLAVVLIPFSWIFKVSGAAHALLIACVLLVLVVELLNSAVEAAVDRISLENHRLAKRAKDIGSAAVLISLLNVALVWGLILTD